MPTPIKQPAEDKYCSCKGVLTFQDGICQSCNKPHYPLKQADDRQENKPVETERRDAVSEGYKKYEPKEWELEWSVICEPLYDNPDHKILRIFAEQSDHFIRGFKTEWEAEARSQAIDEVKKMIEEAPLVGVWKTSALIDRAALLNSLKSTTKETKQ